MSNQPKAFISYAASERDIALRLCDDLKVIGVEAWQFDRSAVPGADAWDTILKHIGESDYFVVLLSHKSVQSRAVREEIDHAHYSGLNSPKRRPVAIPLILDDSVAVPPKLARAVRIHYRLAAHYTVISTIANAMGVKSAAPLFGSAAEIEVTLASGEEFEVEREVEAFFSSLLERNSSVSEQYQALVAPIESAAGGRFKHGERTVIEWFVPEAHWRFRDNGGKRHEELLFLVREPLVLGLSHGYMIEDVVVAQVRAVLNATYAEPNDGDFALTENRLTLRFEGFPASIPAKLKNYN